MENEAQEFQVWLRKVVALAKDGDQGARHALWKAFNSLALPLAQLAKSDISSIDFDLFQGVLQYSRHILARGLSVGDSESLTYAWRLAVELCVLIEEVERRYPDVVGQMKEGGKILERPVLKRAKLSRAGELARMIFGAIKTHRLFLRRFRKNIESRDYLTRLAEQEIRILESKEFKEVLQLSEELNAKNWRKWWKVGKKILKWYWEKHPQEYESDLATLGANPSGNKTPKTYAISKVRDAFETLLKSQK